jgi:hypothetical protein
LKKTKGPLNKVNALPLDQPEMERATSFDRRFSCRGGGSEIAL